MTIGTASYLTGAVAQLFLGILIAVGRPQSERGRWLTLATIVTATWCALLAVQEATRLFPEPFVWTVELLRSYVWLAFLCELLHRENSAEGPVWRRGTGVIRLGIQTLTIAIAVYVWLFPVLQHHYPAIFRPASEFVGQLALAVIGLALVEQFYRNTRPHLRWRIKFMCLALGGLFAYDFYLYSDAIVFHRLNANLWLARGAVAAVIVPLIAMSAERNPEWSLDIFISRRIIYHSVALLASVLYLLGMVAVGYYIQRFGGEWGPVIQVVFLVAALLILALLLFSSRIRARLRVFVSKNFFDYAYDYREEWLKIIATLSDAHPDLSLEQRIILALGQLVESPSGLLWVRASTGDFACRAVFGSPGLDLERLERDDPLLAYMREQEWIVNLPELAATPNLYGGLHRPDWLDRDRDAWLLVPLFREENDLYGVVMLTKPRAPIRWNWEVIDLLKTASRLAASYLALEDAGRQLAEAKQFEGFNRLSAFVIHDLKNLIAQLTLIVRNAQRHRHKPEFVEDAFRTLEHAVERMNRLINQLRNAGPHPAVQRIDLVALLREVIAVRRNQAPAPRLTVTEAEVFLMANRDRLSSALEHIIHNAQDAARKQGEVMVRVKPHGTGHIVVEVEDNGPGMSIEFIRNRLFRPFDTTKGLTGMGIGAYDSREYIRSLGGDIVVRSEPDRGTVFSFILPINRASSV